MKLGYILMIFLKGTKTNRTNANQAKNGKQSTSRLKRFHKRGLSLGSRLTGNDRSIIRWKNLIMNFFQVVTSEWQCLQWGWLGGEHFEAGRAAWGSPDVWHSPMSPTGWGASDRTADLQKGGFWDKQLKTFYRLFHRISGCTWTVGRATLPRGLHRCVLQI